MPNLALLMRERERERCNIDSCEKRNDKETALDCVRSGVRGKDEEPLARAELEVLAAGSRAGSDQPEGLHRGAVELV